MAFLIFIRSFSNNPLAQLGPKNDFHTVLAFSREFCSQIW